MQCEGLDGRNCFVAYKFENVQNRRHSKIPEIFWKYIAKTVALCLFTFCRLDKCSAIVSIVY